MNHARRNALSLFALVLFTVPALSPLLSSQLLASADGQLHLYRLVEFDRLIRAGILFTRWMPDLAFGYGFPLFSYYAPLAYYLTEPFVLFNVPFSLALNLSLALSLLVAAGGVFLWLNELTVQESDENEKGPARLSPFYRLAISLLAALAYLYSPYLLFNALARANLAEAWALAFAPWATWAFTRLEATPSRTNFTCAVLGLTAVLLSHNVTGLLFTPLLAGYVIIGNFFTGGTKTPRLRIVEIILAFCLPFALSGFFWLPALLEQSYVQIARVIVTPDFDYRYNFVSLADLAALLPRADTGRLNTQFPATLGIIQILLAVLYILLSLRLRQFRKRPVYFTVAVLLLVGLMLSLSESVWARVPFLPFVQHPARLRGLVALMLAPLAGYSLALIPGRLRSYLTVASLGLVPLFAFPMLYPRVDASVAPEPTLATMYAYETQSGALGTTSFGEYLPAWVETLPNHFESGTRLVLPDGVRLSSFGEQPIGLRLRVLAANDARLVARTFYFPGWSVLIDGQPAEILPTAREGLISFNVPVGEHRIEIGYAGTAVERIAEGISFAGALFFIGLLLFGRGLFTHPIHTATKDPVAASRATFTLLLLALALITLKFAGEYIETPFVAHFGSPVSGVTQASVMNFGDELVLLGADFPTKLGGQPNETLRVRLIWRAAHPLARNYSVAVHLLDGRGNLVTQSDHLHPGQLPTSRWEANAYVEDAHTLVVSTALAPGAYSLIVRVYDVETGKRLLAGGQDGFRLVSLEMK